MRRTYKRTRRRPYFGSGKRYYKRAFSKRRSVAFRSRGKIGTVARQRSLRAALPLARKVNFKYIDNSFIAQLHNLNGFNEVYIFRGNSLFDPDHTGIGVQPYAYDNYAPLFGAYFVRASSITVYVQNIYGLASANNHGTLRVYVIPVAQNGVPVAYRDPSDLSVYPKCKQIQINGQSTPKDMKIKHYCTQREMFPGQDVYPGQGAVAGNPANSWYWHVYFDLMDGYRDNAETYNVIYTVKIKFYSQLFRPQSQNES